MTEQERQNLIEKRENGTLTPDEYEQYLDLLDNDPTFADELALHQLLTDDAQARADEQLWAAVESLPTPETSEQRPFTLLIFLRQNARYIAAAGVVLVLGVVAWFRLVNPAGTEPQLVKAEKRDVRLFTDSTELGYDDYGGSVWVQYIGNQQQVMPQTYTFCRDTLRVFLKNSRDTVQFQAVELLFNSKQQILYVKRANQPLRPLRECSNTPLPFPASP